MFGWLRPSDSEVYIRPWNQVIAERHEAATARMLLGACSPPRIVGDRVVEERERRLAARDRA